MYNVVMALIQLRRLFFICCLIVAASVLLLFLFVSSYNKYKLIRLARTKLAQHRTLVTETHPIEIAEKEKAARMSKIFSNNVASHSDVFPLINTLMCPNTTNQAYTTLTLFTTFRLFGHKDSIYLNTLHMWPKVASFVRIVLYMDETECDETIVMIIQRLGWCIRRIPKVHSIEHIPIFRYMFIDAIQSFNSTFYMYANGDILFDKSLGTTMKFLVTYAKRNDKIMVIGRRHHYQMSYHEIFDNLEQVAIAKENATLCPSDAIDYFATTANGIDWEQIPDFVVGRVAYDNWMMAHAVSSGTITVDATETILALHQTGQLGIKESRKGGKHHIDMNKVMARRYNYKLGFTICASLRTISQDEEIILAPLVKCSEAQRKAKIPVATFDEFKTDNNLTYTQN